MAPKRNRSSVNTGAFFRDQGPTDKFIRACIQQGIKFWTKAPKGTGTEITLCQRLPLDSRLTTTLDGTIPNFPMFSAVLLYWASDAQEEQIEAAKDFLREELCLLGDRKVVLIQPRKCEQHGKVAYIRVK